MEDGIESVGHRCCLLRHFAERTTGGLESDLKQSLTYPVLFPYFKGEQMNKSAVWKQQSDDWQAHEAMVL